MGFIFVATRTPAAFNATVKLELYPPGAKMPLRVDGRVERRVTPAEAIRGRQSGMRVRFLEPTVVIEMMGIFARGMK